jgi:hypothetical protein
MRPLRPLLLLAAFAALAACGSPGSEAAPAGGYTAAEQSTLAAAPSPVPVQPADQAEAADASLAELPLMHIYKTPTCGCCADWVTHVEQAGFPTQVYDLPSTARVRAGYGVPMSLASCHTAVVGDYVIEGHVPADLIVRLLRERPAVTGLAVPGMPMGSPGMEGPYKDDYDVIAFGGERGNYVFARR